MKAVGRAPVVPPGLRALYDGAQRVIVRHQPVVVDRLRCSYCGEIWECEALVLAEQAQRVALHLVLAHSGVGHLSASPLIHRGRDA